MLVALLCLQAQATALSRQPLTIDVVGYQQVMHALPNGAPDLAVPDNFYVRVTSHYHVLADSDTAQPDEKGTRTLHKPGVTFEDHEWYEETGRASKELAAMFKEVTPPFNRADYKKHKTSWGSSDPQDQPIYKGNHVVIFERLTTIDKVETHTIGRRHVTRIKHSDGWGFSTTGVREGDTVDPSGERVYWSSGKTEVRVDPPVYTYEPLSTIRP